MLGLFFTANQRQQRPDNSIYKIIIILRKTNQEFLFFSAHSLAK